MGGDSKQPSSPSNHAHTSSSAESGSHLDAEQPGAGSTSSSESASRQDSSAESSDLASPPGPSGGGLSSPGSIEEGEREQVPGIPQPILIISLVSATLTMASCVFNTLLPIYMVTELKMNMRSMGAFEGLMEGFSYIVRMFSGVEKGEMVQRKAVEMRTGGFSTSQRILVPSIPWSCRCRYIVLSLPEPTPSLDPQV